MIANAGICGYLYLMKALVVGLVLACLSFSPSVKADSPDDQYVTIYALIEQGDNLSDKGNAAAARAKYVDALKQLKQLQADNPHWNTKTVKFRIEYLAEKLAAPATGPGAATTGTPSADTVPPVGINAGEPVEFKIKWQVGKQYQERLDLSVAMDLKLPGSQQPVKQVTTIGETANVKVLKEIDGGGHDLEMELQAMQIAAKMGGTTLLSFDSQKEPGSSNPLVAFKKLVGARFTAQADGTGKIATVGGVQEAMKGLNTEGVAGVQDMVKGLFSENTLKEFFDQGEELPDHPVKVGDMWSISHESLKEMGGGNLQLQVKFKGWSERLGHKCAVLEYSGKVTPTEGEGGGLMGAKIEDGQVSGTSWFDPILGMTVDKTGQLAMNVKVSAQGQSIGGKMAIGMNKKIAGITDAK